MIVGPPLCDYFGTFETAKHGSRTAGRVKSLKASCRSWGEKPGIAAKPEDWEVGFEQHRSKWSEIGNGSILHKWNQVGWLLYINVILFCAYFDQNKNEIHVFDVFKVHPVVWICSSLSRQSTRVSDLCFSRSPGRNSKKSQLAPTINEAAAPAVLLVPSNVACVMAVCISIVQGA